MLHEALERLGKDLDGERGKLSTGVESVGSVESVENIPRYAWVRVGDGL